MRTEEINYDIIKPEDSIAAHVKYFWHLTNNGHAEKKVIILPDGYFDIIFSSVQDSPYHALLVGLATAPAEYIIPAKSVSFAISFKLSAAEYILNQKLAALLNHEQKLPSDYWNMSAENFTDFISFTTAVTGIIKAAATVKVDMWKQKLFDLVYAATGIATIKQISDHVHWSSRQINRYFNTWFGLNLKSYSNILRYRATFKHLKEGKLFPEEHFADQSHFIKEIKKYSGATPKELARNKNDRFIQLSTLPD